MKILSIDTSSNICSVSILEDTNIIAQIHLNNGKTHSENLMTLIQQALQEANITLQGIQLLACCKGPGSFTGIRIGIATINAMAEVLKIPVIGVSSLQALAYNENFAGTTVALIDARNNQVYAGVFDENHNPKADYLAEDIDEVIQKLQNENGPILFIGDGAILHNEKLTKMGIISDKNEQTSVSIALAAFDKYNKGESGAEVMPLYLRKSQAERMRQNK